MKTCLFCTKKGVYNINNMGRNNHIIKEDMFKFFGYEIEDYLKSDDSICKLCMNLMENLSKLKRRLLPLIYRSEPDCLKLPSLGKQWNKFASMSFDDEEENNDHIRYRTPTPSNLIKCTKVAPYNSLYEQRIEQIERHRSLSRATPYCKSEADSEVARVFSHKTRKRKRGNNWSRRKNGRYSRPGTSYTYTSSRPSTNMSDLELCFSKNTNVVPIPVSLEIYQCHQCKVILRSLDALTNHRIDQHKELALFWCYMCNTRYITKNDLFKHNKTHETEYNCVICERIFSTERELLLHWQTHVNKSVTCEKCRKKFLDERVLLKHKINVHFKRNLPSRIDYRAKNSETNFIEIGSDFQVKILIQNENS